MNAHTAAETTVREFATAFPTAQVQRAVELCETGTLAWGAVAALFEHSLGKALAEVSGE